MSELPTNWEIGDAYALRTFAVKDGRLTSIVQGGGHGEDGKCIATCRKDPDHVAPVEDCTCGVYAFWTVEELLNQYLDFARHMVAVVRLDGECIEGDNGVKANAGQIVAWWYAEDADELIAACEANAPDTRRYFDRDVMLGLYPPPSAEERRN